MEEETDQEEIANLESEISTLESELDKLREDHVADIEELIGENIEE